MNIYFCFHSNIARDVVTVLLIFIKIYHFNYALSHAHTEAHIPKHTCMISTQEEWRQPGTGAWLGGAEDFFLLETKARHEKKCRHTDISNLKQEKIRGNRASSKATGQDYGIIKATSINSLPFLDAPQRERVKVDQVSDPIRILCW